MANIRKPLIYGVAASAAVVAARAFLKPIHDSQRKLLDWDQLREFAYSRTKEQEAAEYNGETAAQYQAIAQEVHPYMEEVLGKVSSTLPKVEVINRHAFIDRNLAITQRLLQPVEELRTQLADSRATQLGRKGLTRYVGEMFGFLSRRVLGQYDPVLYLGDTEPEDHSSLFVVEPNIQEFITSQQVDSDAVRKIITMHETTHAWQFEQHPWLREHLINALRELVVNKLVTKLEDKEKPAKFRERFTSIGNIPNELRQQWDDISQIQAVMTLIEGHGNFVMNRAGAKYINDFAAVETAMERRKKDRATWERVIMAVTGMRMKLRQYEVGEKFADTVTDQAGLEVFNRVWEGPELLPSLQELQNPQKWIKRATA